MRGSSPLTRGKPLAYKRKHVKHGLIPAHAGKTPTRGTVLGPLGAHPRSRGENRLFGLSRALAGGSSPLTRGKLHIKTGGRWARGLIPAHAGKTGTGRARPRVAGAHPRSRGENDVTRDVALYRLGSSPLTRGKPPDGGRAHHQRGLIPAHAGKTPCLGNCANQGGAHPRSRGEN